MLRPVCVCVGIDPGGPPRVQRDVAVRQGLRENQYTQRERAVEIGVSGSSRSLLAGTRRLTRTPCGA